MQKLLKRIDEKSVVGVVLVTGPSGTGKSFLKEQLTKRRQANKEPFKLIIELDEFGEQVDGKWLIDYRKLQSYILNQEDDKRSAVLFGISDNISEIVDFIKVESVMILKPSIEYWRDMQTAKVNDAQAYNATKPSDPYPPSWIEGWINKAKFSQSDLNRRISTFVTMFGDNVKLSIMTYKGSGKVKSGWHRKS